MIILETFSIHRIKGKKWQRKEGSFARKKTRRGKNQNKTNARIYRS